MNLEHRLEIPIARQSLIISPKQSRDRLDSSNNVQLWKKKKTEMRARNQGSEYDKDLI
jgi:hypothetical protein